MVRLSTIISSFAALAFAVAAPTPYDPLGEYSIEAGNIKATFLPYGATLKNLYVKDRWGQARDIALGYDDPTLYVAPTTHTPRFNTQIGRYADRLAYASFTLDGVTYNTTVNGHSKVDPNINVTFHGGIGFDYRNFSIVSQAQDSIVFHYFSPDGEAGFPGDVDFYVSHHVEAPATWSVKMWATFSQRTPFMPTTHLYLQLNAFNESEPSVLNHTLYIKSDQYQGVDANFFSTDQIITIPKGALQDFSTPKLLGDGFNVDMCGVNCTGYDALFVYEPYRKNEAVLSTWSDASGIRLDVTTDRIGTALYTCGELTPDSAPKKAAHGSGYYEPNSCIFFEQQSYVDAIHWQGELPDDTIFSPSKPFYSESTYTFSTL
ncbi:hypothetical protein JAAARDRAFT_141878 [Jaapia argillacea MUCL 33604]|uniref:Aldose 1-epimerase n=1 Tax=Jaapia argillacea MUCL 33604 TaxID=933084 RepID=A0A067PHP6_9AGAM|nr:hypothetical protein JAAARDRAFT_141878 [Jaapia argillacea MUCL 33604]